MGQKGKEIILKASIILTGVLLLLSMVVIGISQSQPKFSENYYKWDLYAMISFGTAILSGLVMFVLMKKIKLTVKSEKAYHFNIMFENFDDLYHHIAEVLMEQNFINHGIIYSREDYTAYLFSKKSFFSIKNFFILKAVELEDRYVDDIDEMVLRELRNNYGEIKFKDAYLTSCIVVDRVTKPFDKFINSSILQRFRRFYLPVGISWGRGTLYIAKQKNEVFISQYLFLRKEFLKLMGLTMKDKI